MEWKSAIFGILVGASIGALVIAILHGYVIPRTTSLPKDLADLARPACLYPHLYRELLEVDPKIGERLVDSSESRAALRTVRAKIGLAPPRPDQPIFACLRETEDRLAEAASSRPPAPEPAPQ